MLSLYIHRDTAVHAVAPGLKVAGLFALGIAVFLTDDPLILSAVLAAVLAGFAIARVSWRQIWRQFRPALVMIAVIFAIHAALGDWLLGVATVLRLAILLLAATLVTLTTRVSAMIETIERGLRPLKPLGVNPAKVGMMLSMTIRFIPMLFDMLQDIRAAQRARGLERSIVAVVVPLLIRALRSGNDLTEAIEARCYDPD